MGKKKKRARITKLLSYVVSKFFIHLKSCYYCYYYYYYYYAAFEKYTDKCMHILTAGDSAVGLLMKYAVIFVEV